MCPMTGQLSKYGDFEDHLKAFKFDSPHKDINKTNSRCNPAINVFYKHILHQHVDQRTRSGNPPASRLERREEVIWSESCALWPKCYSEMNLWVTLALIFVYLSVHFKIDWWMFVSGFVPLWGVFHFYSFLAPFCVSPARPLFLSCSFSPQLRFVRFSCFNSCVFAVPLPHSSTFTQPDYAIDTGKPLMHAV